jgi:rhodanese-related sulfurtransferase
MPVTTDLLTRLEPISALSSGRLQELSGMCSIERVSQGLNPFRMNVVQSEQLLYLLSGQIKLTHVDGATEIIEGGSDASRHALGSDQPGLEALAITDIQILRIDADLLDIMLTWDQLAGYEKSAQKSDKLAPNAGEWMDSTGVFSAESLKNGIFRMLPPANVEEMFRRMQRIPVQAGQVIIKQGDEGDYYYLIEYGVAEVSRLSQVGAVPTIVVRINAGTAFGEEALVSGNKRNATVAMQTDGTLLRLGKEDFIDLLRKPLLKVVSKDEAMQKIQQGAQLLDVRTQAEFSLKHLPGALNKPLHDIREAMKKLDKEKEYLVYCQTGRRAAAATFVMAQEGFNVMAISST